MGRPFNVLTNVAGSLRRFLGAEGPLSFRDDIKNPVRARRGMTQTTSSASTGPHWQRAQVHIANLARCRTKASAASAPVEGKDSLEHVCLHATLHSLTVKGIGFYP